MRGSPKKVKNEKADVDGKSMSPLCTYGRDEAYINNKLWLSGVSTIILWGVGDGMIPWCALEKRIPIMCLYDKDLHQRTIEDFLLGKIIEKMKNATPKDKRWYKTNEQLCCRANEEDPKAAAAGAGTAKAAAAAKTVAAAKAAAAPKAAAGAAGKGTKNKKADSEAAEEESSSSSSASSKKSKKAKTA